MVFWGKNLRFVGVLDILGSGYCSCIWIKIVWYLGLLCGIVLCVLIKGCGNVWDEVVFWSL